MVARLNQTEFEQLKIGSVIQAKSGILYTIEVANCGGPGKYPTHLVKVTSPYSKNEEQYHIFHDGDHIRHLDTNDKELDNCIVGDLEI